MSCHHSNPPGYSFCATCGEAQDVLRCRCGFSNPKVNLYCGQCGLNLNILTKGTDEAVPVATLGKYNLDEFISKVVIQKKRDEEKEKEKEAEEENSGTMSQDDIANLFGNIQDKPE